MKRIAVVVGCFAVVFASGASAQNVSGRVTGTVGEIGSIAGQAKVSSEPTGSQAPDGSTLPNVSPRR